MNVLRVRALLDVNQNGIAHRHNVIMIKLFDFAPHEFCGVRRFLSQQFFLLIQEYNLAMNALSGNNDRMQFFFTVLDSYYPIPEEVLDGTISDFIPFIRGAVPNADMLNVFIRLRD